jgi:co-chaperonin GroES (HSP10)
MAAEMRKYPLVVGSESKNQYMATIRTLFDRVLLQKEEFQETAGGLFAPSTEDGAVIKAKVLCTGHSCQMNLKPGTQVLIGKYSGIALDSDIFLRIGFDEKDIKEKKIIVREQDILAVIE